MLAAAGSIPAHSHASLRNTAIACDHLVNDTYRNDAFPSVLPVQQHGDRRFISRQTHPSPCRSTVYAVSTDISPPAISSPAAPQPAVSSKPRFGTLRRLGIDAQFCGRGATRRQPVGRGATWAYINLRHRSRRSPRNASTLPEISRYRCRTGPSPCSASLLRNAPDSQLRVPVADARHSGPPSHG